MDISHVVLLMMKLRAHRDLAYLAEWTLSELASAQPPPAHRTIGQTRNADMVTLLMLALLLLVRGTV